MAAWWIVPLVLIVLIGSVVQLLHFHKERESHFSIDRFYSLMLVYIIVMIGFGLIYFSLASEGRIILEDAMLQQESVVDRLAHAIYFSGVTLMTVGYGDITPIGIGRVFALMEALIGCVLPAAYFAPLIYRKE
ncbi:potassium channel family protein [Pontibacillus salicampi]|uniref:Potassium channel family protein n=1 Tax=Pontibacillus salicampi TaxID=1449801 RepID=A0ABV6LHZ4_9BACI